MNKLTFKVTFLLICLIVGSWLVLSRFRLKQIVLDFNLGKADSSDIVEVEHFDDDLSRWQIEQGNGNQATVTTLNSYEGRGALLLDYQNPTTSVSAKKELYVVSNVLFRVFFYDDMTNLGTLFGVSKAEKGAGIGVVSSAYSNTYAIRVNTDTIDSTFARTKGWHLFEIIVTNNGTYFKIDNEIPYRNSAPISNPFLLEVNTVKFVSTWGLTGQARYDELTVVKANTRPWSVQIYEPLRTFYRLYSNADFSGIYASNEMHQEATMVRGILDTATSFYLYGKKFGDQNAVQKGLEVLKAALDNGDWDRESATRQWQRGVNGFILTYAVGMMWNDLDGATRSRAVDILYKQANKFIK